MVPQFKTPKAFTTAQFWAYNAGRQSVRRNEWLKKARAEDNQKKRAMMIGFAKEEHRASLRSLRESIAAQRQETAEAA